jgi:O-antigen/teichoic acid export membrane protein
VYKKNLSTVLTGTVVAQAIPVLGYFLIARICTTAEFGIYATWFAVSSTLAILLSGHYEYVIALEPAGADRTRAVAATILLTTGVWVVLGCVAVAAAVFVPDLQSWRIFIFIGVGSTLLFSLLQLWQLWAGANSEYRALSWQRVLQSSSITCCQLGCIYVAPTGLSLALGQLLGLLLCLLVTLISRPLPVSDIRTLLKEPAAGLAFLMRHGGMPKFALPGALLNSMVAQLPTVIVSHRFGADGAGLLAMAQRFLAAPVALVGKAVLDIFRQQAASAYRASGRCDDVFVSTMRMLAALSTAVALIVFFLAPTLFPMILGDKWALSGHIAIWLIPQVCLGLVASPLSYVFFIVGKPQLDLVWQICLAIVIFFALQLPSSLESSIKIFAFAYGLMYMIYLLVCYRFSKGAAKVRQ